MALTVATEDIYTLTLSLIKLSQSGAPSLNKALYKHPYWKDNQPNFRLSGNKAHEGIGQLILFIIT